jgi:hypothetical protein
MVSANLCVGLSVAAAVIVAVTVITSVVTTTPTVPDNVVYYPTNQCGVPDSFCNTTFANPNLIPCPFPFNLTATPFDSRIIFQTTFNQSICNQLNTFLSIRFQINLAGFITPVPDNYTAAAQVRFAAAVNTVLPGANTVIVNVSFVNPFIYGSITVQSLTNVTLLQAELVLQALQQVSYGLYWDLPVTLTGWNSTASNFNTVNRLQICSLNAATCPADQTCVNWLSNAVCICNFPNTVRYPNNTCSANPCWPQNGGCSNLKCTVNFGATGNRVCS